MTNANAQCLPGCLVFMSMEWLGGEQECWVRVWSSWYWVGVGSQISLLLFLDSAVLVAESMERLCGLVWEFGGVCERTALYVGVAKVDW